MKSSFFFQRNVGLSILWLFLPSSLVAATSNWIGAGSDFNTASNWDAGVPMDVAAFNTALPTSLTMSASTALNTLSYSALAPVYQITIPTSLTLQLNGSGITNLSTNQQVLNIKGTLQLGGSATTANNQLVVLPGGKLDYTTNSHAGNSIIHVSGNSAAFFEGSASAENATITVDPTTSSGTSGELEFSIGSTGGNAVIINNGTLFVNTATFSAGSLSGSGDFAFTNSAATIGGNNSDMTISGGIRGSGSSITKLGHGVLTLSGFNDFTGSLMVTGGTLNLLSAVQGDVGVGAAGTLTGNSGLQQLTNNGMVVPAMSVANSLTASSYSGAGTLLINMNGASHGSLTVSGNANLSGGQLTLAGPGVSVGSFDALTATSITGTFAQFNTPSSNFLTFTSIYSPTDVRIRVGFVRPFSTMAQTENQRSVTQMVDAPTSATSPDYTNHLGVLLLLPSDQGNKALDQIDGDSLASFQAIAFRNAAHFIDQMRDKKEDQQKETTPGDEESSSPPTLYGLWARGIGFFDRIKADNSIGSPSSNDSTGGFQAGYDYVLSDDLLWGISGGYAKTILSVDDRMSVGNVSTLQSGIHVRYAPGPWDLEGAMAYSGIANEMTRRIQYSTVDETAGSSFDSRLWTAYAAAHYTLDPTGPITLEPGLSLRQSHLQQDSFQETGAPGLDLLVHDHTANSLVSSLGTQIRHTVRPSSTHPLILGTEIAWEHEWQDVKNELTAQFIENEGATTFTTQSTPRSRNAAAISLDSQLALTHHLNVIGQYTMTLGSEQIAQALFGGIRLKW